MKKPLNKPECTKQPVPNLDRRLKKELLLVYGVYAAFANAYEKTFGKASTITVRTRKAGGQQRHLSRAIISAESWDERDKLLRRLASQCYKTAQLFLKNSDPKNAVKWMNLTLRFLRLSLDPKAKQQMDQVLGELAELNNAMKDHEEKQQEDGDNDQEG